MPSYLTSEVDLRKNIGTAPKAVSVKKMSRLESHSQRYLEMSHLIAITSENIPNRIHLVATQQSKLVVVDETTFTLEVTTLSEASAAIQNQACGLYVLVAGFEESLRINGKLSITNKNDSVSIIEITLGEHYFHCAKSIKRSKFWTPIDYSSAMDKPVAEASLSNSEIRDFIRQSPFLLLATQNQKGETDLSPRGDPGGFLKVIDENKILIPERPGNKIADSLSNLIGNDSMAIILFVPGSTLSLIVTGHGKITNDKTLLSEFEINNKSPKVVTELSVKNIYFGVNSAMVDNNLWDEAGFADRSILPSLGMMISDQLRSAGKIPGSDLAAGRVLGKVLGTISELAIKQDYKKNMY
ncbi:MAG: pyridoxamine 5'-phosphate oxidase family protein [Pseudomonadales bacterium]|nr:pyridoxamine 5'-phosphate oxidase family protein [Pseudomonadales bacterium]